MTEPINLLSVHQRKAGWLNEFLWSCAGVNKAVLRQCPSDYAKYAGIGGTILFTALMASFSGGYALSYVFETWWVGVLFGIFWGLLIFNLDRFIVNTMYSDGKVTISWQELKSGAPRIIMAIFLGIVISYPLELKIFDDEIQVKIEDMKQQKKEEYLHLDRERKDSLEQVKIHLQESPVFIHSSEIVGGNIQLNKLLEIQKDLNSKVNHENSTILALTNEIKTLKKNNEKGRNNVKINQKRIEKNNAEAKRNALQSQLSEITGQMSALDSQVRILLTKKEEEREKNIRKIEDEIKAVEIKIDKADSTYQSTLDKNFKGFQAQMSAFNIIKNTKLENETMSSTQLAAYLIMILFIIIETAPTFFKMMMEDGPYDELLRAYDHEAKAYADRKIAESNNDLKTDIQINTMKNENRLEAEKIANEDILQKIAKTQSELLEVAIKEWREVELKKIKENPFSYFNNSVPPDPKEFNVQS